MRMPLVSCSELRLFEISRILWVKAFVLKEQKEFKKGQILHKIVEKDFLITEDEKAFLSYDDMYALKKIKEQITKLGKLYPGVMLTKTEKLLKGKPDGLIEGKIPVEVKFNKYRKEDKVQAMAYAYLLDTRFAYLVYPNMTYTLELKDNHVKFLKKRINTISKIKKILLKEAVISHDDTNK